MGKTPKMISTEDMPRKEWLELRRKGIGGSDVGALLGVSPYGNAQTVYGSKVEGFEPEVTPAMKKGIRYEPAIRLAFEGATGKQVVPSMMGWHPHLPFVLMNADGLIMKEGRPVAGFEAKYSENPDTSEWGEPGSHQVPKAYYLQCMQGMAVFGVPVWYLAADLPRQDTVIYVIERDPEMEAAMLAREAEFMKRHVEPRVPPGEFDGGRVTELLRYRYPRPERPFREATDEDAPVLQALRSAEYVYSQAATARQTARNRIMDRIGDAEGLLLPGGEKVTWREERGRASYKKACEIAGVDREVIEGTRGEPTRVLRVPRSWSKEREVA